MSHQFSIPDDIYNEIATHAAQRGQTPDALLVSLLTEGVELLKQGDTPASLHAVYYDPAHDPLTPFIDIFDSGEDDPHWIERHDEIFSADYVTIASKASTNANADG